MLINMYKTPNWQDPEPISVHKLPSSLLDPIAQDSPGVHGGSIVWRAGWIWPRNKCYPFMKLLSKRNH